MYPANKCVANERHHAGDVAVRTEDGVACRSVQVDVPILSVSKNGARSSCSPYSFILRLTTSKYARRAR